MNLLIITSDITDTIEFAMMASCWCLWFWNFYCQSLSMLVTTSCAPILPQSAASLISWLYNNWGSSCGRINNKVISLAYFVSVAIIGDHHWVGSDGARWIWVTWFLCFFFFFFFFLFFSFLLFFPSLSCFCSLLIFFFSLFVSLDYYCPFFICITYSFFLSIFFICLLVIFVFSFPFSLCSHDIFMTHLCIWRLLYYFDYSLYNLDYCRMFIFSFGSSFVLETSGLLLSW